MNHQLEARDKKNSILDLALTKKVFANMRATGRPANLDDISLVIDDKI